VSPAQRCDACLDLEGLRELLVALRAGRAATWHAYDWAAVWMAAEDHFRSRLSKDGKVGTQSLIGLIRHRLESSR
jgi:hypothetical protein